MVSSLRVVKKPRSNQALASFDLPPFYWWIIVTQQTYQLFDNHLAKAPILTGEPFYLITGLAVNYPKLNYLVGGWTTRAKRMLFSNWESSGVHKSENIIQIIQTTTYLNQSWIILHVTSDISWEKSTFPTCNSNENISFKCPSFFSFFSVVRHPNSEKTAFNSTTKNNSFDTTQDSLHYCICLLLASSSNNFELCPASDGASECSRIKLAASDSFRIWMNCPLPLLMNASIATFETLYTAIRKFHISTGLLGFCPSTVRFFQTEMQLSSSIFTQFLLGQSNLL